MDSLPQGADGVEPVEALGGFRRGFYACLGARADELFELTDALLCSEGPVRSLVDLSLAPEHRRGHGGLYDGINHGGIEVARLRRTVAGLPLPRVGDRIRGKGNAQMIPGWPYSIVAGLQPGRTSWTAVLDAVRLGPADDATAVTASQLRDVVTRLIQAGHRHRCDPDIWIVMDSETVRRHVRHLSDAYLVWRCPDA
jgi:hypothetical protein